MRVVCCEKMNEKAFIIYSKLPVVFEVEGVVDCCICDLFALWTWKGQKLPSVMKVEAKKRR